MIAFVCLSWSIKPTIFSICPNLRYVALLFAFSFCRNTELWSYTPASEKRKKKKENLLLYNEMLLTILSDQHSVTRSYPAHGFCWKTLEHPFYSQPGALLSLQQRRWAGSCTTQSYLKSVFFQHLSYCWAIFSLKVFPKPALCPAARQSRSENKLLFMRTVLLTLTLLLNKTLKLQTGNMSLAEQPGVLLSP